MTGEKEETQGEEEQEEKEEDWGMTMRQGMIQNSLKGPRSLSKPEQNKEVVKITQKETGSEKNSL